MSGQCIGRDGWPVPGILIRAESLDRAPVRTISDARGFYELSLEEGGYEVVALVQLLPNERPYSHLRTGLTAGEVRKAAVVDSRGGVAAHTGAECIDWAGHKSGAGYSCQANLMVGDVVTAMQSAAMDLHPDNLEMAPVTTLSRPPIRDRVRREKETEDYREPLPTGRRR